MLLHAPKKRRPETQASDSSIPEARYPAQAMSWKIRGKRAGAGVIFEVQGSYGQDIRYIGRSGSTISP
jgi:hypothetical protein